MPIVITKIDKYGYSKVVGVMSAAWGREKIERKLSQLAAKDVKEFLEWHCGHEFEFCWDTRHVEEGVQEVEYLHVPPFPRPGCYNRDRKKFLVFRLEKV